MTKNTLQRGPKYQTASDDYLLALGTISLSFNRMEGLLLNLHRIISKNDPSLTTFQFQRQDTGLRLDVLKKLSDTRPLCRLSKGIVYDLCGGYEVCAHNRNMLLHTQIADPGPVSLGGGMRAKKFSKRGLEQTFILSSDLAWKTAWEIEDWWEFTRQSGLWILSELYEGPEMPLPDTPEVPTKIEARPQNPQK